MKPLPLLLCGAALVWGATCSRSAPAAFPSDGPPDFAAPLPAQGGPEPAWLEGGTGHLWAAPPLPPLPGADLWQDYHAPLLCDKLHRGHRRGCKGAHGPVLGLVGDVLDGFFALLSFKSHSARGCRSCRGNCSCTQAGKSALQDCGCYPPAGPAPDFAPGELTPLPPRNEVPRLVPPRPLPEGEGEGLAPAPVAPSTPPAEQRLYPGRAPVVELAPEINVPREPGPLPNENLPPRNAVPKPGDGLPRNVIP
jgi:hypothetical protein